MPLSGGEGILLTGKSFGCTDLLVWEKGVRRERRVCVREGGGSLLEEARLFFAPFPATAVRAVGNEVVVSGSIPSTEGYELARSWSEGRKGLHFRMEPPAPDRALLAYDLKIVELSSGENLRAGVKWPDSVPIRVTAQSGGGRGASPSAFAVGTDFEARLDLMMADGRARILANPRIVCQEGKTARFVAGGEIPIVIVTQETRSVTWKPYGIVLEIEPARGASGRIDTRIVAEISTIDHGSGTAEIPGFLTRRVETRYSSKPGSSVLLSGLVRSDMAKDVAKVPLIGQVPILGELFKSRSFRESRTELAVFITASAAADGSAEKEEAEWDGKRREAERSLRFRLMD
jgi:pilus assembly protein CpaC